MSTRSQKPGNREVPVWLLDIDGVVNAVIDQPDLTVWPAGQWIHAEARINDVQWPVMAARPVLEFVCRVHEERRAEVRWHSTWQAEAAQLADVLGLPELPVQQSAEFEAAQALGGAIPGSLDWWKLPAADRIIDSGRPLIWTDDDATLGWLEPAQLERVTAWPNLLIAPQLRTGLTRAQLHTIDQHLTTLAKSV